MPTKFAYRLTVKSPFGQLYRSFRDVNTAHFMAEQAKAAGWDAIVTVYVGPLEKPNAVAIKPRGRNTKKA